MAVPVEYRPRLDYDARAMNLARYYGIRLNVDPRLCLNLPIEAAPDEHAVSTDLTFNRGVLAQNQRVLGDQGPLHRGIDAKSATRLELPLKLHSALEKTGPFARFVFFSVKQAPRHLITRACPP